MAEREDPWEARLRRSPVPPGKVRRKVRAELVLDIDESFMGEFEFLDYLADGLLGVLTKGEKEDDPWLTRDVEVFGPDEPADDGNNIILTPVDKASKVIQLPLVAVGEAPAYDTRLLQYQEHPDVLDDAAIVQWYTERGQDPLVATRTYLLPELGPARYFSLRVRDFVVAIRGRRYRVVINLANRRRDEPWESEGKSVTLIPTDDPETEPDRAPPLPGYIGGHYYQFLGRPRWIQNDHFPAGTTGEPCYNLVTIEDGWGDAGNHNILISLDSEGYPDRAYHEASCY